MNNSSNSAQAIETSGNPENSGNPVQPENPGIPGHPETVEHRQQQHPQQGLPRHPENQFLLLGPPGILALGQQGPSAFRGVNGYLGGQSAHLVHLGAPEHPNNKENPGRSAIPGNIVQLGGPLGPPGLAGHPGHPGQLEALGHNIHQGQLVGHTAHPTHPEPFHGLTGHPGHSGLAGPFGVIGQPGQLFGPPGHPGPLMIPGLPANFVWHHAVAAQGGLSRHFGNNGQFAQFGPLLTRQEPEPAARNRKRAQQEPSPVAPKIHPNFLMAASASLQEEQDAQRVRNLDFAINQTAAVRKLLQSTAHPHTTALLHTSLSNGNQSAIPQGIVGQNGVISPLAEEQNPTSRSLGELERRLFFILGEIGLRETFDAYTKHIRYAITQKAEKAEASLTEAKQKIEEKEGAIEVMKEMAKLKEEQLQTINQAQYGAIELLLAAATTNRNEHEMAVELMEEQIEELQHDVEEFKNDRIDLEDQIADLCGEAEMKEADHNIELKILEKKHTDSRQELVSSLGVEAKVKEDESKLAMDALQKRINELIATAEETAKQHENELKDVRAATAKEVNSIQSTLRASDQENRLLREEVNKKDEAVAQRDDAIKRRDDRNNQLHTSLTNANKTIAELNTKLGAAEQLNVRKTEEHSQVQRELSLMEMEDKRKSGMIAELTNQRDGMVNEMRTVVSSKMREFGMTVATGSSTEEKTEDK